MVSTCMQAKKSLAASTPDGKWPPGLPRKSISSSWHETNGSEERAACSEASVPPSPPLAMGALNSGTVRTPMRFPLLGRTTSRASTSPCLRTARRRLKLALLPSARRTLTLTGSSSLPRRRPATSSAVAYVGSARPSTVSKRSPTCRPAAAAGPPGTMLTISIWLSLAAGTLALRNVTPIPPLSAGRSYLASSAL